MLALLTTYGLRIAPGCLLGAILLALLPRTERLARILIYIWLFVLLRDAMTPLGMWRIQGQSVIWIRFLNDGALLALLGLSCLGLVLGTWFWEPELRKLLVWFRGSKALGLAVGLIAPLLLFAPIQLAYELMPLAQRGGPVSSGLWPGLLLLSLLGNFYEESLFRGYLQGYCETLMRPLKAAAVAGVAFAFGHVFLAATVTTVGLPILLFTLYEGLACALLRMKFGLIPATLTHGLLIFLLAAGLR